MTITLAVHPWHGEAVGVLGSHGENGVFIERGDGHRRVVRVSWTSLAPSVPFRLRDGRVIHICPEAALELARWVAPRLGEGEEVGRK